MPTASEAAQPLLQGQHTPAPTGAPPGIPGMSLEQLQQVVALGEPAWYAYRDVAPEAGHYKVRIDYTNARKAAEMTPATRVRDGGAKPSGRRWWWPWGGSSGKEKQQKGAAAEEDEDDDSTAIWYIKNPAGKELMKCMFAGQVKVVIEVQDFPQGVANALLPPVHVRLSSGDLSTTQVLREVLKMHLCIRTYEELEQVKRQGVKLALHMYRHKDKVKGKVVADKVPLGTPELLPLTPPTDAAANGAANGTDQQPQEPSPAAPPQLQQRFQVRQIVVGGCSMRVSVCVKDFRMSTAPSLASVWSSLALSHSLPLEPAGPSATHTFSRAASLRAVSSITHPGVAGGRVISSVLAPPGGSILAHPSLAEKALAAAVEKHRSHQHNEHNEHKEQEHLPTVNESEPGVSVSAVGPHIPLGSPSVRLWRHMSTWYQSWSNAAAAADMGSNLYCAFGTEAQRLAVGTNKVAQLYEPVAYINYLTSDQGAVDSQAWVMVNSELCHVVLAFRGTTNLTDWLTDANILQLTPFGKDEHGNTICVHKGFYLAYHAIKEELMTMVDLITASQGPSATWRVVCTGHSLGGALATLAAYELMRREVPGRRVWLTTFGSPRVGNKAFAGDFMERQRRQGEVHAYRVANIGDIVPRTPVGVMWNFWHVGTSLVLDGAKHKVLRENEDQNMVLKLYSATVTAVWRLVTSDMWHGELAVMHNWSQYLLGLRHVVDAALGVQRGKRGRGGGKGDSARSSSGSGTPAVGPLRA